MRRWFPIQTERLLLREFASGDEHDIQEYAGDPEVVRYADWGPNDLAATRVNLARRLAQQREWPRDNIELAMELSGEGRVIGILRITVVDNGARTADFGYTLNRRYWRHGFATEGAAALLNAAFVRMKLHRVWATCDARNHASYRVMEKLGMRREAHFHKDVLQKGEWRDSYLYAILAEEWLALNEPRN
jgi:ribosomal-protein-alanine N-acetyltransferase